MHQMRYIRFVCHRTYDAHDLPGACVGQKYYEREREREMMIVCTGEFDTRPDVNAIPPPARILGSR